MARGEVTGRKPAVSAERSKRDISNKSKTKAKGQFEATPHTQPSSAATTKRPPIRLPPTCLFTIKSFCLGHGISESFYHELRKQGVGPKEMRLGARVFITHEAAAEWRAEREAACSTTAE
jgi:hypothetical protein